MLKPRYRQPRQKAPSFFKTAYLFVPSLGTTAFENETTK